MSLITELQRIFKDTRTINDSKVISIRTLFSRVSRVFFPVHARPKVFVVGYNKTGTTSMEAYFRQLSWRCGPQRQFEELRDEFFSGRWDRVFELIDKHDAFQDTPFSTGGGAFVAALRDRYPDAKFILTVRDSAEQWFNSLERFHRGQWFGDKEVITWDDVASVEYIRKGYIYASLRRVTGPDAEFPYDREVWMQAYNAHNESIRAELAGTERLLEVNLREARASEKLADFLDLPHVLPLPHLNQS